MIKDCIIVVQVNGKKRGIFKIAVNSDEDLIDVGLLNAALIVADACPVNIIEKNQLDIILKNHQNHLIHTTPVVPKNLSTIQQFQYTFDGWKARDHKKIPVPIFCPCPYSLFSL